MITYVDTSVILKLLLVEEDGADVAERLWSESDVLICVETGYVETRAALGAAHRNSRLTTPALRQAKAGFEDLWLQVAVVVVDTALIRLAGDVAESDKLRGYDAVHLAAAITGGAAVFAAADGRLLAAAQRHNLGIANPLLGYRQR